MNDREKRELVILALHPSLLTRAAHGLCGPLYRAAERCPVESRRAAVLDWLGDRADDLGLWANRRKARKIYGADG